MADPSPQEATVFVNLVKRKKPRKHSFYTRAYVVSVVVPAAPSPVQTTIRTNLRKHKRQKALTSFLLAPRVVTDPAPVVIVPDPPPPPPVIIPDPPPTDPPPPPPPPGDPPITPAPGAEFTLTAVTDTPGSLTLTPDPLDTTATITPIVPN